MQLKGVFCLHIDNKSIYIIAQSYVLIYSQQILWKKKVKNCAIFPSIVKKIQFSFNNFAKRIVFRKLEKRKNMLTFAQKLLTTNK